MNSIKKIALLFQFLSVVFFLTSCQEKLQKADLIITNAHIWTAQENQIIAEAMAIVADSIIAIGTNEEIAKYKSTTTEVIDMEGKFISPGFIDCHVHIMTGGNSLLSVYLTDARTKEEFKSRIEKFTQTLDKGIWILEGNWDHSLWGGELPNKTWIDKFTKDNPVAISRLDGHMMLANSKALEIAGINKNTPEVMGGKIMRNPDGTPTGILKDNAMDLVYNKIPPNTEEQKMKIFKTAMHYFLSNGVTSVHDVDGENKNFESYSVAQKLKESGDLAVRIYVAKPLSHWKEFEGVELTNDKWLKRGFLKGYVDGSLGSHTAALNKAYLDKPKDKGLFINTEEDLYKWISDADKINLHITVHAIGDRAIHTLLNIYERIIQENGKKDRRLRIEHAQHIDEKDIKRFAELGVIASMQAYHLVDDGRWAEKFIGPEVVKTTYAFKSLIESKAVLVFGSDWAVAPASPILGIYAAVTRRTSDDKKPNGWVPEQKISVEQSLLAYTKNAAYASFDEDKKGILAPGKLADFVVLSDDITKIDPTQIKALKVLQTFVGGKKVFDMNDKKGVE